MQIIYRAYDIIEAHLLAGMLHANGIMAHVSGQYLQGGIGEISPMNFANVMVNNSDIPDALPIVEEYENNKRAE